eukprot:gb/GECG01004683.1/.p1 GENE.gb/GECG01004683.1/~~gb/GECG01004683.1/.p1  ORF type:complete len:539 (+),score=41.20 gb/GECG01004683.1/:1-1617(+)
MSVSCSAEIATAVVLFAAVLCPHVVGLGDDSSHTYVGASIQYAPQTLHEQPVPSPMEANRQMLKNLASLSEFLVEAKDHGAQILVLPEQGLSGFPFTQRSSVEPYLQTFSAEQTEICNASMALRTAQELETMTRSSDPAKKEQAYQEFTTVVESSSKDGASPTLYKTSCIARGMRFTLVVDVALSQSCSAQNPTCPQGGHYQFNTQVAFGSTGEILSHYNKNHLYVGEAKIFDEPPDRPTLKYFDTDFGVRFGQFICFDIFFHAPPIELHTQLGINNFVFSTYWNNDGSYPLISATQIQQAVSQTLDANLIASNVGYSYLHSGSGIYSRGVPLNTTFVMNDYQQPKLMMAKLPKQPSVLRNSLKQDAYSGKDKRQALRGPRQPSGVYSLKSFNIEEQPSGIVNVTHGNLSCSVDYSIRSPGNRPTFALIALNGYYFDPLLPAQLCSVAVCPSSDCSGKKLPIPGFSGSQFSRFALQGAFSYSPVFPMALSSNGTSFDYTSAMNLSSHVEHGLNYYEIQMSPGRDTWITSAVLYTTNMN